MNLNDLKIFEAVAANGSFTKAANEMFTVQSNVTARIKSLEEEFNSSFFKRNSRNVELTDAGKTFMLFNKKIQHLVSEVKSNLELGKKQFGSLKIGCLETTMALKVPGIISHFTDSYPGINLSFKADNSPNLLNDVLNYRLDAAFIASPVIVKEVTSKVISTDELVIVTSQTEKSLDDYLTNKPVKIIVFDQGCSYRPRLEVWLGQHGINNFQCTVLNTLEGIVNFVEAGIGITLLPQNIIDQLFYNRKLTTYPVDGDLGQLTTLMVFRNDVPISTELGVFLELFS